MTKLQSILLAVQMTVLCFFGLSDDGYIHKGALFVAGAMFAMLFLTAWMEWKGLDE
jgi:hypothetical protein